MLWVNKQCTYSTLMSLWWMCDGSGPLSQIRANCDASKIDKPKAHSLKTLCIKDSSTWHIYNTWINHKHTLISHTYSKSFRFLSLPDTFTRQHYYEDGKNVFFSAILIQSYQSDLLSKLWVCVSVQAILLIVFFSLLSLFLFVCIWIWGCVCMCVLHVAVREVQAGRCLFSNRWNTVVWQHMHMCKRRHTNKRMQAEVYSGNESWSDFRKPTTSTTCQLATAPSK